MRGMRPINLIVIHCSATPAGMRLAKGMRSPAEVIDDWHRARGFARSQPIAKTFNPGLTSIGYHYVIDVDGKIYTGRSELEVGAHAAGFNAESVGVCLVGGASSGQYTAHQWQALRELVLYNTRDSAYWNQPSLTSRLGIDPAPPRRRQSLGSTATRVINGVCGHRDLSEDQNDNGVIESFEWSKVCPFFDVQTWLERQGEPFVANVCPLIEVT